MIIRLETPADYAAVERLTYAAFETMTYPDGSRDPFVQEHYLLHTMRGVPAFVPELDFVGEAEDEIVANIAYTKSKILRPNGGELATITFGPVSVKPELHKQGLGSEIIRYSLNRASELGYGAVVIFGHPDYYPRFGFKRAKEYHLSRPDYTGIFDDAFMALELIPGYLGTDGGVFHEDKVFKIDPIAREKWHAEFHAIENYIAAQPESVQPPPSIRLANTPRDAADRDRENLMADADILAGAKLNPFCRAEESPRHLPRRRGNGAFRSSTVGVQNEQRRGAVSV
jgi:predicted N-acetyltransferase YhbS